VVDKNKDTAEETAKLGKLRGSDARAFPCDVSDRAEVRKTSREIDEAFRRIDILVNNAEVFIHEPREQSTDEVVDLLIGVNLKGLLDCTRAAVPIMKRRKRGIIVNACSILGAFPDVGLGVYGATKSAVALLTRVMASVFAPYGIRVNAYQPAVTDTPMVHHVIVERPESCDNSTTLSQVFNRSTAMRRNSFGYLPTRLFATCSSFPCKVCLIRVSQVRGSVQQFARR
jgi:3-oxoacyl-[acyl-carrier protein] reductase